MKPCILLIEDDSDMRDLVAGHLEHGGFDVHRADDGIKGQALAFQYCPDLNLLDLMLPKVDGITLCQRLRREERTAKIPILMLTALGGTKDKVSGFNSGADDYLTKPFELDELLARLRVLERRLGNATSSMISIGPLSLNTAQHEVLLDGAALVLSRREYMLLKALVEHVGVIQTREGLEAKLYSWGDEVASNAIEVHIHNLRKKLPPNFIRTLRGIGYMVPRP